MQSSKNFIALFLISTCLITEGHAQYKKVLRGDRNPYDTAVIIDIPEYRIIRKKVTLSDSLVNSLRIEIDSSYSIIGGQQKNIDLLSSVVSLQGNTISRKDSTITALSNQYDALHREVTKPRSLLDKITNFIADRPLLGVALGGLAGFGLSKL